MKITEMDLMMMDFDFFFKDGEKVIHVASCGESNDKFLDLEEEEDQNALFDYFDSIGNTSEYNLHVTEDECPDASSFTGFSSKGIYSYDNLDDNLELMSDPKTPLKVSDLPEKIQNLLTDF